MLKKCESKDRGILTEYLSLEKEFNTFLLADLQAYGFQNDCQDVWMEWEQGKCTGVYLRFYSNLLLYSREDALKPASVDYILKNYHIFVIMGKSALLNGLERDLEREYRCSHKRLYRLADQGKLKPETYQAVQAKRQDVGEIFAFLGSIPQIRGLYTSRKMIEDRIANGDGVHLLIREDGKVVSHGNSTTGSDDTVMIGGVATAREYRGRGYASCIVSALARLILAQDKTPCLFAAAETHEFFVGLGFEYLGGWTTLERNGSLDG